MDEVKKLGCCTVCDEPIFEIIVRHVEGPFKGEPKQLGMPLPGARRLTVVRASGRQSNWSLCGECEVWPADFPRLNRKEVRAMVRERAIAHDTPEQAKGRDVMLKLFEWDIPLGILGEKPWLEVV